ncbi:MAG TPA: hypothetical protein VFR97_02285 [Capillimicrobium sp.]|nr:hypothetical protein [Capillimicrobium sp.]
MSLNGTEYAIAVCEETGLRLSWDGSYGWLHAGNAHVGDPAHPAGDHRFCGDVCEGGPTPVGHECHHAKRVVTVRVVDREAEPLT